MRPLAASSRARPRAATGIAFGAALLASAPVIGLYLVLPTAFAILGSLDAVEGVARWLDQSRTMEKLVEETFSGTQWARLAASVALWTLLPLVVGWIRVARSDVLQTRVAITW